MEGKLQEELPEPEGKRKRTKSPHEVICKTQETEKEPEPRKVARKLPLETGATTPVGVKVRRIQEKLNKEKQSNAQQFQPTLRSFMEIRGGLEGSQR